MSAISLKSITGITSITTPAGVDDQLTLHNNNTTERVKIDVAGNVHINNQLAVAGVTTMSGNLTISNTDPRIIFTDTNNNPDFTLHANGGAMQVENSGSGTQVKLESSGSTRLFGNVICNKDLDVDGHTNLDNVSVAGIMTISTSTQYHGYKLGNGTNVVAELVGLSGTNDTGALALWSGGSKYVQLSAQGDSYITGGNVGINSTVPRGKLDIGFAGASNFITFGSDADNPKLTQDNFFGVIITSPALLLD